MTRAWPRPRRKSRPRTSSRRFLHENEAQLVDRDEDGNPGYVYTDGEGERKMAILVRSEENVKVKKYKAPKAPEEDA